MPRTGPSWTPKLGHHRGTGRGRVCFPGQAAKMLGPRGCWPADVKHPPEEVRREYDALVAAWLATRSRDRPSPALGSSWPCREVARGYLASLEGRPGHHPAERALVPVQDLYGDTPAAEFDARAFVACRNWHLDGALRARCARAASVNKYMSHVRSAFRWAARPEQGGCPASVVAELSLVRPLVDEEWEPVEAAPRPHVEAAIKHAGPVVAAMLEVHLLSGMRPGEVVQMCPGDIDRTGQLWLYRPRKYKSRRSAAVRARGGRKVWIGPRAQEVLRPWLEGKADDDPVFPSQRGRCYGVSGYRQAVFAACDRAGVPRFQVRQIRHTAATLIQLEMGLEYAQNVLDHERPDTTARYAHAAAERARKAMARLG